VSIAATIVFENHFPGTQSVDFSLLVPFLPFSLLSLLVG